MRPKSLAATFAHRPLLWINGDSLTQPILMRFDKYLIRQQHPDKFALILKLCNFKFVELLNPIVIIVNPSVGTLARLHLDIGEILLRQTSGIGFKNRIP